MEEHWFPKPEVGGSNPLGDIQKEDRYVPAGRLRVLGQTTDGKLVVDIFTMIDTYGLPLDLTVALCKDHDLVPSWTQFWTRALQKGWKQSGTLTRLKHVVEYVYGKDFRVEWERRMQLFINPIV